MSQSEFQVVSIDQVRESRTNPRRNFRAMDELTASVRAHGVLVPLLVRPIDGHYEIVAGARRYRAARAAELTEIPVRVKQLGDNEALELQVIENLQREDVHPMEEALGYRALLDRPGYEVAAIAGKVGRSESYVYQRLKLLELIEPAQKLVLEDQLTAGHAILIARLQPRDQAEALEACFDRSWTRHYEILPGLREVGQHVVGVRQLAGWIHQNIHLDLHTAPFKKDIADLVPAAGPCTICAKRTGFLPQLFPDVAKKDTCTDRVCYEQKLQAHIALKKRELEAKGPAPLQVTTQSSYNVRDKEEKKLLPSDRYTRIRGKKDRCESAQKAIVVAGYNDRGMVLEVCADQKCKQHGRHGGYRPDPREAAKQKAREEKRKRDTETRRRILEEILGKIPAVLAPEDWNLIAASFVREMQNDDVKMVVRRRGWEPVLTSYGGKDYREAVKKRIPGFPLKDLQALLIELSLVGEVTVPVWSTDSKPKELLATAARYGIDVRAIEKEVAAQFAARKKNKGTEASAKTKKARKAGRRAKHVCEICGCTNSMACVGGCAWSEKYLALKRWVCDRCEDRAELQTSAEDKTA